MAPTTAASCPPEAVDRSLQYIMLVLSTCEAFKPNYHDVATKAGICDANTAQKKFKKFVEQAGYSLFKGAITAPNGDVTPVDITPNKKVSQGKKSGNKAAKTPGSNKKKRKIGASGEETATGENE
ncbi:hypothetical protein DV736_g2327, partial [Chaetothyriales sp. CBS 134916]